MNSPIQLVIPAAGAGSRFRETGVTTPKPLIEIAGIPMILWVLSNFSLKRDDTVVIVSQLADELPFKLQNYLDSLSFKITFVEIQGLTSGPASTVQIALAKLNLNLPVIVANSDQYVSADLSPFLDSVRSKENPGLILTMKASGNKWSYIGRDPSGIIDNVIEKVQISNEATVGIYAWSNSSLLHDALNYLEESKTLVNNEYYVAPSYNYLIQKKLFIESISVGDHGDSVHGLGTPEDLLEFLNHPHFDKFSKKVELSLKTNPTTNREPSS